MKEFIANKKNGKKLYRKTYRKYRRWIWGNVSMILCFAVVCLAYLWVIRGAAEFSLGTFIVGTGVAIIPLAIGLICRGIAVSGGREVLMNRLSDKVKLFDEYLSMEYVPHARETVAFDCIKYQISYRNINDLEYEKDKGRLKISGEYQIKRYRKLDLGEVQENVNIEKVSDGTFFLYAYYDSFDLFMEQLCTLSGLKVKKTKESKIEK